MSGTAQRWRGEWGAGGQGAKKEQDWGEQGRPHMASKVMAKSPILNAMRGPGRDFRAGSDMI